MRWILDDGPFDVLASVQPEGLIRYPPRYLVIAQSTALAAKQSEGRTRLLGLRNPDGGSLIDVFEVIVSGSDPAGTVFLALHPDETSSLDRAECEAIAWALTRSDDAVFVTEDTRAALTALAELGRARVAHPFDLWIDLLEENAVSTEEFRQLCHRTQRKDQGLPRMPDRAEEHFAQ